LVNFDLLAPTAVKQGAFELIDNSKFCLFWTGDMPHVNSVYMELTLLAKRTNRIKLGIGCTNPYTRHPFVTASAVSRVNQFAKGRMCLAFGAGTLEVLESINMGWVEPVKRIKEAIEIIRGLLRGETLTYDGEIFKLKNVKLFDVELNWPVPIYVACRGPTMLKMAGANADGVLMDDVPVEYVGYAINRIKKGCKEAGRSLKDFRFSNLVPFSVSKDRDEARELVKRFIAINLFTVPKQVLDLAKVSSEGIERIKELWPDYEQCKKYITEDIIDKFSISGTLDECLEHIDAFIKAGINEVSLALPRSVNLRETIEVINKEIIPRFKD